jgi:hypothetical protein
VKNSRRFRGVRRSETGVPHRCLHGCHTAGHFATAGARQLGMVVGRRELAGLRRSAAPATPEPRHLSGSSPNLIPYRSAIR